MDFFRKLFGVDKNTVREDCVLLPLAEMQLFAALGAGPRAHGDYFRVQDTGAATLIGTHYSLLVGDCVLALAQTACRRIYLFNCAGGLGLEVGDVALVEKAVSFESFTQMLEGSSPAREYAPSPELTARVAKGMVPHKAGTCATVASLALEEPDLPRFAKLGVNCFDMESAQVFAAAKHIGRQAAAVLYVTNLVPDKPWHETLSKAEIARLGARRRAAAEALCAIISSGVGK